jgi:NAD(P)H-hydrate epimerase
MKGPTPTPLILSRDEVRAFDAWAIQTLGLPGVVLMENAGRSCAEVIRQKRAGVARSKACIFCGTGNNGGDGYVIARHLLHEGLEVTVVLCGDPDKVGGDARINLDVLRRLGQPIESLNPADPSMEDRVRDLVSGAERIVDAIFGTGLKGQVAPPYARLIEAINGRDIPILAVDIPSGLDCDTGRPLGAAIRADTTVTFVALKKGFLSPEARSFTGEVIVASIGVDPSCPGKGEN